MYHRQIRSANCEFWYIFPHANQHPGPQEADSLHFTDERTDSLQQFERSRIETCTTVYLVKDRASSNDISIIPERSNHISCRASGEERRERKSGYCTEREESIIHHLRVGDNTASHTNIIFQATCCVERHMTLWRVLLLKLHRQWSGCCFQRVGLE